MAYKFKMKSGTMENGKAYGITVSNGSYDPDTEVCIIDGKPVDSSKKPILSDDKTEYYMKHNYASFANGALLVALEE